MAKTSWLASWATGILCTRMERQRDNVLWNDYIVYKHWDGTNPRQDYSAVSWRMKLIDI